MYTGRKDKDYPGKRILGCFILIGLIGISLATFAVADDEPNDSIYSAEPIYAGDTVFGTLDEWYDEDDYYEIYLYDGDRIHATMSGTGDDFDLFLFSSSDIELEGSAEYDTSYESFSYTVHSSGHYYVNCWAYDGSGSYTLTVTVTGGTVGPGGISPWVWAVVGIVIIVVVVIIILAIVLSKRPPKVHPQPPSHQQQQWQQPPQQQPPPQQAPPPQQPPQQPPPGNP